MSAPAAETMLAAELWISFGSVLRSYVAAGSLNMGLPAEVQVEESRISALAGGATLDIRYDANTATAVWELRGRGDADLAGGFELLPEGTMRMDGRILDLDHAAIDFAAALMERGKGK